LVLLGFEGGVFRAFLGLVECFKLICKRFLFGEERRIVSLSGDEECEIVYFLFYF
jgi:hypothetical protein